MDQGCAQLLAQLLFLAQEKKAVLFLLKSGIIW